MITIIGTGRVGTSAAFAALLRGLDEKIVLLDIVPGLAQGEALDLGHAAATLGADVEFVGSENFELMEGSEIVLVTAGKPRKPGMTREQLLADNAAIVADIAVKIKKYAPESVVIMTTNPLDAMVYVMYKKLGFPRERVIGFSGVLDSARLAYYAAKKLKVSYSSISPIVVGMHGEAMYPVPRLSTVGGVPLTQLLSKAEVEEVARETVQAGATITKLRGYSSSYAPGLGVVLMAEAVKRDAKKVFIASVYLDGEYGLRDVVAEVPVVLGRRGAEKVLELPLNEEEREGFLRSVEAVRELIRALPEEYRI
ncbi:MAG: malate dehydrogenase [Acidilobaceae archaeon]|nr:malate dehydrogenase [Acidilobaceae archaeon]